MANHVKILGILHIVFAAFGIMAGLIVLFILGGLAGVAGIAGNEDGRMAIPILGGIGGLVFMILMAFSLPGLIAGVGLLNFRPWSRPLTIVLSVFELLHIPFGTALGIYGLWVLMSSGSAQLFLPRPAGLVRM